MVVAVCGSIASGVKSKMSSTALIHPVRSVKLRVMRAFCFPPVFSRTTAVGAVSVLLSIFPTGCGNPFVGKWVKPQPSRELSSGFMGGNVPKALLQHGIGTGPGINFSSDDTWTSSDGLAGRYRVSGNDITVPGTVFGTEVARQGHLEGDRLKIEGDTYLWASM